MNFLILLQELKSLVESGEAGKKAASNVQESS